MSITRLKSDRKSNDRRIAVIEQTIAHHSTLLTALRNEANGFHLMRREFMETLDNIQNRCALIENSLMNLGRMLEDMRR